jgi:hypothetical protein
MDLKDVYMEIHYFALCVSKYFLKCRARELQFILNNRSRGALFRMAIVI